MTKVDGKPNYDLLPEHLREGMRRWIEDGIQPGRFLSAVLENDLQVAVGAIDGGGLDLLRSLVLWRRWHMPYFAHGSRQYCKDWAMRFDRGWR